MTIVIIGNLLMMELKSSYGTTLPRSKLSESQQGSDFSAETPAYKLVGGKWEYLSSLALDNSGLEGVNLASLTKLKVKGERAKVHPNANTYQVKLTLNARDLFYAFDQKIHMEWMVRLVWGRHHCSTNSHPEDEEYFNICEGAVMKKGMMGGWQPQHAMITQEGLSLHDSPEKEASLRIDKVSEVWTRFEYAPDGRFMVFKMRYRLLKYELGIPVHNLLKWCRALYSLIDFQ